MVINLVMDVRLIAGDDFTGSGPFYVTFPAGENQVKFVISITNDDVVENNESFTLSINPSSLPLGVTVGDPSQTTVTIIDDDSEYQDTRSCVSGQESHVTHKCVIYRNC